MTQVAARRTFSRTGMFAIVLVLAAVPARAEPFGWPQVQGAGTPVAISYSFINLLDPAFQGLSEWQLRAATAARYIVHPVNYEGPS